MKSPPRMLDGAVVFRVADLSASRPTGQTRHIVGGREVTSFAALALGRYEGQDGVYLLYCDADWNVITDTWHADLGDAERQAAFEFEGVNFVDL